METIIRSSTEENTLMIPSLKTLIEDITVFTKTVHAAKAVLQRRENLSKWSQMKFEAKKSRSYTTFNIKRKEERFRFRGEIIPTETEEPKNGLGRWYKDGLTGRHKGVEIY